MSAPGTARLDGRATTLLLTLPSGGVPLIAYFGPRLPDDLDLAPLARLLARAPRTNALDVAAPGAALLPTAGAVRMGLPALSGHRAGLAFAPAFEAVRCEMETDRLVLSARDRVAGLDVTVSVRMSPESDVFAMQTSVVNVGQGAFTLVALAAGVFLAPSGAREILTFAGSWGREFGEVRETLGSAVWLKENRRGRTSHDAWPSLILGEGGFGDDRGRVLGVHLAWSGNHRMAIEPIDDGRALVHAGEFFHPGEMILPPGATYDAPMAYAAIAEHGLDELSARFHAAIRREVLPWRGGTMPPRPVTLNTWEGNYFDHDVGALQDQATAAAALGIERFVLDDGWFLGRNDDRTSLGDWIVDPVKYPQGLAPLIDHVRGLGMQFGLWVEPEMVSPDSELYRRHPDWALAFGGRPLLTGRHQLVLDLARSEVAEYLFDALDALLKAHAIDALKWDMNRDLAFAGTRRGQAAYHGHVVALYALIDRLRAAHPHVEIESCASGGGRADLGMLARTHRIWTSDCTDALERLAIQRGFSRFMPPEIMGAHVSASPNHQTGRQHSLDFRALVAMAGHFGVELNPMTLAPDDAARLGAWIALHKRLRPLLHGGRNYLRTAERGRSLRMVVSMDQRGAVAILTQESIQPGEYPPPLRLPGLDARRRYRLALPAPQHTPERGWNPELTVLFSGEPVAGALLAEVGLTLPELPPESGLLIELVAEEG